MAQLIARITIAGSTRRWSEERGAGLVEYALLLALISIVCLSALQVFGAGNSGVIHDTADSYASATN